MTSAATCPSVSARIYEATQQQQAETSEGAGPTDQEAASEGPEGDDRAENVRELIAGALDFDAELLEEEELPADRFTELDLFPQRVSLVADVDLHDPDADSVTLMTLHNAKGLEFPVVFISGMEDGLFPLSMGSRPQPARAGSPSKAASSGDS